MSVASCFLCKESLLGKSGAVFAPILIKCLHVYHAKCLLRMIVEAHGQVNPDVDYNTQCRVDGCGFAFHSKGLKLSPVLMPKLIGVSNQFESLRGQVTNLSVLLSASNAQVSALETMLGHNSAIAHALFNALTRNQPTPDLTSTLGLANTRIGILEDRIRRMRNEYQESTVSRENRILRNEGDFKRNLDNAQAAYARKVTELKTFHSQEVNVSKNGLEEVKVEYEEKVKNLQESHSLEIQILKKEMDEAEDRRTVPFQVKKEVIHMHTQTKLAVSHKGRPKGSKNRRESAVLSQSGEGMVEFGLGRSMRKRTSSSQSKSPPFQRACLCDGTEKIKK